MVVILSIYVNLSFYTCVQKNFFSLRLLFLQSRSFANSVCHLSQCHTRKEGKTATWDAQKMSTKFEQTPKAQDEFGTFVTPLVKPTSLFDFNFIS